MVRLVGAAGGVDGAGIASGDAQTDGYSLTRNAYFGDLHIHTGNSFDAYIFNVRSKPEHVYKFAIGEKVAHPSGYEIELDGPPLDFVAATDHGAYMGILPEMDTAGTDLSKLEMAKTCFLMIQRRSLRLLTKLA